MRRACEAEMGQELRDSVLIQRTLFADRRRIARIIHGVARRAGADACDSRLSLPAACAMLTLRRRLFARAPLFAVRLAVGAHPPVRPSTRRSDRSLRRSVRSDLTWRLSSIASSSTCFGAPDSAPGSDELDAYRRQSFRGAVERLLNYETIADDVDTQDLRQPGTSQITCGRNAFSPRTVITDARQRWLFRMVHTNRPLQEKMTLFWHNHFATAYSKISGSLGTPPRRRATWPRSRRRIPAACADRSRCCAINALGNFRDLLVEIAKDTAMLVWLDGRNNVRTRPQENFGREIMELFTMGVGHYTEQDVYAAARVFTGWNLRGRGAAATA